MKYILMGIVIFVAVIINLVLEHFNQIESNKSFSIGLWFGAVIATINMVILNYYT